MASFKQRRIAFLKKSLPINVTILLVLVVAFIHLQLWPKLLARMDDALREGTNWSNIRLCCTLWDGVNVIIYPHSSTLLKMEESTTPHSVDSDRLSELLSLPGVLDAFYLDFTDNNGQCVNGIIDVDSLKLSLDVRGKKRTGGASRMTRRTVGGLVKTRSININDQKYPLMVRYMGTYYPALAEEAIGLVMDEAWIVGQVPVVMDSLYRENQNLLFTAPMLPDTNWNESPPDDIYAAPGGFFKQTLGVMHGNDTLWWAGDPEVDAMSLRVRDNYYIGLNEFNIMLGTKTEFPTWRASVIREFRKSTAFLIAIEVLGVLLIVTFYISFRMARKQVNKNRIALAHLAHGIKTPISRLRLTAETLVEERAISPEEERTLIKAVGNECDRLDLAVRNAGYILEKDKGKTDMKPGNLNNAIVEVIEIWKPLFDNSGIRLIYSTNDREANNLFNTYMMTIMLDNLLDNALRHTKLNMKAGNPTDPLVSVSLQYEVNRTIISVEDSGSGIKSYEREKVFMEFYRSETDAATGVSGLGIGLSLVKDVVKKHKGSVTVTDGEHGGARFVVELPSLT